MTTDLPTECVVVGAGLAGLSAATRLNQAGVDCVVLEARDRVGGRACSVRLHDGTVLDYGGQWIGASHHRLSRLGGKHGLRTFRQYTGGDTIIRARGRTVRASGRVPWRLGAATLVGLAIPLLTLDVMARSVNARKPWTSRKARRWDARTLEAWIERRAPTAASRAICRAVLTGIFAADPSDISLLHALTYIRAGEGLDTLTGTVGAAQDACFVDGVQTLAERMAHTLDGRVRLGQPVRGIVHDSDGVSVCSDEVTVRGRHVIVAIPPTLAGRIAYSPPMPAPRDQLTQRVPQGSAIKCFGVYDTPFWRTSGSAGLVLDCDGPISMIIDGSGHNPASGVLIGFFEGHQARDAAAMTPDARRETTLACFARHFGARALDPREYRDQDWSAEPYTRGCYAGFFPPGVWTSVGAALREPIGRIHWAGTETGTEWMGYFEGALESGERAAGEVLAERDRTTLRA